MIIKLAILDGCRGYADRLTDIYRKKYTDVLELFCFSNAELLCDALARERFDVILLSEDLVQENVKLLREALAREKERRAWDCVVALLTNEPYQEKYGIAAICRYQRMERLYREVLALYTETNADAAKLGNLTDVGARTVAVTGASGGAGASSVAAALCLALARRNRRVIYLNLEPLGSGETYFSGEGQDTLSDVLYAVKSNRANLAARLEGMIRYDESGVGFFAPYAKPSDYSEMSPADLERLLTVLRRRPEYDVIVLDVPFAFDGAARQAMRMATQILLVCGDDETSRAKLRRVQDALDADEPDDLLRRVSVLGNRDAVLSGARGSLPRYEGAREPRALAEEMARHKLIQTLAR